MNLIQKSNRKLKVVAVVTLMAFAPVQQAHAMNFPLAMMGSALMLLSSSAKKGNRLVMFLAGILVWTIGMTAEGATLQKSLTEIEKMPEYKDLEATLGKEKAKAFVIEILSGANPEATLKKYAPDEDSTRLAQVYQGLNDKAKMTLFTAPANTGEHSAETTIR